MSCKLKSRTKLALGIMGVALAIMTIGLAMATIYAMPLTIQDMDQTRERDQIRDRDCLQYRERLGNQSICPNFVDADGDGICDNCPREQNIRIMNQHRYGW